MAGNPVGPNLIGKAQKKDVVKKAGSQSNPKEVSEIDKSEHFSKENMDSAKGKSAFGADESYRNRFAKLNSGVGSSNVSRAIEERPDSYAMIRLIKRATIKANTDYKTYEQENSIIPPYTRFFLQRSSYVNQEKYQIIETFGDFKIFLFGKRPVIKQFGGYLLNTKNQEWLSDFEYVYDNYLRGTQAVKLNAVTYLTFDNVIISGYIIMAQFNREAMDPNGVPFSFQMIITDKTPIDLTGTKERNRLVNESRDGKLITDNEKALPNGALEQIRKFFNNNASNQVKEVKTK